MELSNMWQKHPNNDKPEAWADLRVQMEEALRVAEKYGETLGVLAEIGNTINSVRKTRRLLDEVIRWNREENERIFRCVLVSSAAAIFPTSMSGQVNSLKISKLLPAPTLSR